MNTFSQVWVFSDTPSRLPELMNGAQALANQINTFVLNDADGAQAIQLGANHVWKLNGKPNDRMIEDYAGVIADTIRQHGADGLVLLPDPVAANYWRQNWGYRLNAAVSNDASTVSVQDGKATVEHMVYGGLAIGEERIATPYAVLTISSGTFDVAQPDASRTGETHTVEWQVRLWRLPARQPRRVRATASISTKPAWWSALVAVLAAKRTLRWQNSFARR
ncbi:hypothetical protein ACLK1Z_00245 [Escherichia coli]